MNLKRIGVVLFCVLLAACDRVGSEAWCKKQDETPKGEWTIQDTGDYAKYCVLGMDSEKWCKDMEKKSESKKTK